MVVLGHVGGEGMKAGWEGGLSGHTLAVVFRHSV